MANFHCSLLETPYCLIFQIIAKLGLGQGCQCSGFSKKKQITIWNFLVYSGVGELFQSYSAFLDTSK
jgi:hypothetical protein